MAYQDQMTSAKKRASLFGLWMILILLFIRDPLYSQQVDTPLTADQLEWITEEIDEGVYWKKYRGSDLNDARLSINLISVDLNRAQIELKLAYNQTVLTQTSDFAKQYQTIAAINGSFFSREYGGSVVFMKEDEELIARGAAGRNVYTENGGIGWDSDFQPLIMERPEAGWKTVSISTLLTAGPLLIFENTLREFRDDPFHQNRHPRTAVGITGDNQLLLVTVDGRSFQSYGMTIPELAQFFSELGATHALNLDGGGSTAMWIHGGAGVVNYPSDNLEFDHDGERPVSNALLIIRRE
jgi:exopolysaccharide biosynthesis protein